MIMIKFAELRRLAHAKKAGVVDNTVAEINELQAGYKRIKHPWTEANEKRAAILRDVDPRNKEVAKAKEQGALIGSGAGAAAAFLLSKGKTARGLRSALGVVPGFIAGQAVAGGASEAYQSLKPAPKGSHNLHKSANLTTQAGQQVLTKSIEMKSRALQTMMASLKSAVKRTRVG